MNDPVLRIGILADHTVVSAYLHDVVAWSRSQPNIRIEHLLVHSPSNGQAGQAKAKPGLYARFSGVVFRALGKVERMLLKRSGKFPQHGKTVDMRGSIPHVIELTPIVSPRGISYRFSDEDIERVKALELDVLIRAGGGILRGGILSASRLGVLSFHHADNRVNRGMPAAFWEVFQREDTTGFTLQRLTEELDGGEVLMRGHFPTRHYYLLNQAALYEKSNYYLKVLLMRIAKSGALPPVIPAIPYSKQLFRVPLAHQTAGYMLRFLGSMVSKRLQRVMKREHRWQVSFVPSNWRNVVMWRAKTIANPAGRYLADPFVIDRDGKSYCFVEDYDCKTLRGRISAYELGTQAAKFLGPVIEEPFHLSFPYLFEYNGDLFMCPESSENKDIRVYRCVEFPMKWKLEKVIMSDVRAADTMLFEKGGAWWMLTNIDPVGSGDYCSDLFVFRGNSPLSDEWVAHSANPVLVDAACARNGGILRDGEKIFRVSQKQGFDRYGKGAQINEILELTEEAFVETCIVTIEPSFQQAIIGTHHMHSSGTMTVFDSLKLSSTAADR